MKTPSPFDLDLTVRSHGWYDLSPWRYDPDGRVLGRPVRVSLGAPGKVAVYVEASQPGGPAGALSFRVEGAGASPRAVRTQAQAALRGCLRLDEDLAPFYRLLGELEVHPRAATLPRLAWAARRGAGRLLRSPSVFEDAVKTLCTTNCSWALTRIMVSNLVERLGEPGPREARDFPTPEAMARQPERFYREEIRAGYRAPFLVALSRAAAEGQVDLEAWRGSPLPTEELGERIRELAGFGPYAAENLLKLLGHYDHLALDSWSRAKVAKLRGRRRLPSDETIRRWYAPYGKYAGLAFWLEVTADWHGDVPAWP